MMLRSRFILLLPSSSRTIPPPSNCNEIITATARFLFPRTGFSTQTSPSSEIEATVVRYHRNGKPNDVLKVEKERIPSKVTGTQVLVRMQAAPINPADFNVIEGTYGTQPQLPAIAGLEGVGRVEAVGPGVKDLSVNDRVIPAKPLFGTWRTHALATEDQLFKVPADIPLHYAATLAVNPSTALRLLSDFVDLKPGDTIIQNGANSMVGQCVVQIAKTRKLRTISVIRERPGVEKTIEYLKSMGGDGDIVVTDKYLRTPNFKQLVEDVPKPRLALNCVGGESATEIARHLGEGGTMVTYGGMAKQPVSIPTSLFIFRDIQFRGFWLTRWLSQHSSEERTVMMNRLAVLVREQKLKLMIEAHRFSDFTNAIQSAQERYRDRKVVLELDK